jgi:hypothetical protein
MLDDTSTAAKSRPDPAVMAGVIPSLSLDGRV